ncbi:MAG: DUF2283 domain-containing protein [Thermodesulfovibrio sp.]|nr:DUF2283 domain-containing protein [Thermodesulfovibrio sp.]
MRSKALSKGLTQIEVAPGINLEFDSSGNLIGIELFKASILLKEVLKLLEKKLQYA